jgi:hypothetical protein
MTMAIWKKCSSEPITIERRVIVTDGNREGLADILRTQAGPVLRGPVYTEEVYEDEHHNKLSSPQVEVLDSNPEFA